MNSVVIQIYFNFPINVIVLSISKNNYCVKQSNTSFQKIVYILGSQNAWTIYC